MYMCIIVYCNFIDFILWLYLFNIPFYSYITLCSGLVPRIQFDDLDSMSTGSGMHASYSNMSLSASLLSDGAGPRMSTLSNNNNGEFSFRSCCYKMIDCFLVVQYILLLYYCICVIILYYIYSSYYLIITIL